MAWANIQNIETIDGGAGYDTLQAGSGDDVLDFSRGRRWSISRRSTAARVTIPLSAPPATTPSRATR